jgi:hypothetical protein
MVVTFKARSDDDARWGSKVRRGITIELTPNDVTRKDVFLLGDRALIDRRREIDVSIG